VCESGDSTPLGTEGTVVESVGPITAEMLDAVRHNLPEGAPDIKPGDYGYFVEWNDKPGLCVFVLGAKLSRIVATAATFVLVLIPAGVPAL
jgi:hypothetical protein